MDGYLTHNTHNTHNKIGKPSEQENYLQNMEEHGYDDFEYFIEMIEVDVAEDWDVDVWGGEEAREEADILEDEAAFDEGVQLWLSSVRSVIRDENPV